MTILRKLELPLVLFALLTGATFLLKMCYLGLVFNCLFGIGFLTIFYAYVKTRHGINIPLTLITLVFLALQVDALGNYFRMYGHSFGPMQYDEFSHMAVQVLITPIIIWLVRRALNRFGYKLSLLFTTFFAGTLMFSLSACYEIIELWDELYFGGKRIWGPYDTPNDLQWDLCGILLGSLLAVVLIRTTETSHSPQALAWGSGQR